MLVKVKDVIVKEGRILLNSKIVNELVESIKQIGLLNPIIINSKNELVAGLHRLEAYKVLGYEDIEASVVIIDCLQQELAEIDENLIRNVLTAFVFDLQLARRKEIYESIYPETKHGGDRKTNVIVDTESSSRQIVDLKTPSFTEQTSKKLNVAKRTIERSNKRVKELGSLASLIIGSPIEDKKTELDKLVKMNKVEREEIINTIYSGKAVDIKSAKAVKVSIKRKEIADKAEGVKKSDRFEIACCDFNNWKPVQLADLIITDPPYLKEYLHCYEELAINSNKWLKDGGLLIAMAGQSYLNQIYELMCKHMDYYWTACYLTPGQPTPLRQVNVNTTWKPLLMFTKKGDKYTGKIFGDVCKSDKNEKSDHDWQQSLSGMTDILNKFALPGQVIIDPFVGSGTTGIASLKKGCLFYGCDIDEQNVKITISKLSEI